MKKCLAVAVASVCSLAILRIHAEAPCTGTQVSGVVRDSTQALIPGAEVKLDGTATETSGSDGKFTFGCVANGRHTIAATSEGFAPHEVTFSVPHPQSLDVTLALATVETQVEVSGSEAATSSANATGPSQTISGSRLQSLADDPDDLQRELQQLAAASGANPPNVTIAVDGFQEGSKLPPKSSIAYIEVNPDQFSAEYREPPFDGARVEVYTKPGQTTYRGALFLTNGSAWENARDPFSTGKAAIGKQR